MTPSETASRIIELSEKATTDWAILGSTTVIDKNGNIVFKDERFQRNKRIANLSMAVTCRNESPALARAFLTQQIKLQRAKVWLEAMAENCLCKDDMAYCDMAQKALDAIVIAGMGVE